LRALVQTRILRAMPSANYQRLLAHLLGDRAFRPFIDGPERRAHQAEWRSFIAEHRSNPPASLQDAECFHDHWHVCHHHLRELVEDESAVLDMLWVWLPRYAGPDLVLYRGENVGRLEAGRLGMAWTEEMDQARMFARRLNAVDKGGALLRAVAPATSIIAGPSRHSRYLQENEFTVDPRHLAGVEVVERFDARP
jgi:hypothetical protein